MSAPTRSAAPRRAAALVLALLTSATGASAQLTWGGRPASERDWLPAAVPTVTLPAVDTAPWARRNAEARDLYLQWGVEVPTRIEPSTSGRLDTASDGSLVWRVRIASPGAYSIGLELERFEPAPGAQLFVYDDARATVRGSYDERNTKPDRRFAILPTPGDAITIEYVRPGGAIGPGELVVGTVIHDFVDVWHLIGGGGGAGGGCLVDVNCPQGAPYQVLKRSVCRVFTGGGLCSAGLVNNTANDGDQLLLSASHCGSYSNSIFLFNYELPGCGTGSVGGNSVQGSQYLTSNSGNDHRLVRILEPIPPSFGVYYAGWQRTNAFSPMSAAITHPSGGVKKVSIDNQAPAWTTGVWQVNWEVGMLTGGSSGGPLFNADGQVLGAAWWVSSFECSTQVAGFNRMTVYWTDVRPHLDPLGTNPTEIGGYDPACAAPATYGTGEVSVSGAGPPSIGTSGQPSVSSPPFAITLSGGNPNVLTVLMEGASAAASAETWGTMWVGGPVVRHYMTTDGAGTASYTVPMAPSMIGATRYFTWLVRDAPAGGGVHHSEGLAVTFCP